MKLSILALASFLSLSAFGGIVPRINCVGSIYNKQLLKTQEVQEDKVLLEYRSGGAAFANTFIGDLKDLTFIVIINKMFPISNLEGTPLNIGIYNAKTGKTLAEKQIILLANGITSKLDTTDSEGNILTLSCSRILNPS